MNSKISIRQNETVGRYAVASEKLSAGEIILTEYALAVGPKVSSPPSCLGCLKYLDNFDIICSGCRWPMCSEECSKSESHEYECPILAKAAYHATACHQPSPQYECITPLRVLLAGERNEKIWNEDVSQMMSHCSERKLKEDEWHAEHVNVVLFLLDRCCLRNRFNEEDIHRACGLLETNAFEVPIFNGSRTTAMALYPKSSIFSHSCKANTSHSVFSDDKFRLQMRTTVEVEKGDELFVWYCNSFDPTLKRRGNIANTKFFWCQCQRCKDPTELGTHLGTFLCTKCPTGNLLSTSPLNADAPWECVNCGFSLFASGISKLLSIVKDDIEELSKLFPNYEKAAAVETILMRYGEILHENHSLNVELWCLLIEIYGLISTRDVKKDGDLYYHSLQRRVDLLNKFLSLLEIIEPGYSRIRGMTLGELVKATFSLTDYELKHHIINEEMYLKQKQLAKQSCEEAITILQIEPDGTTEKRTSIVLAQILKGL